MKTLSFLNCSAYGFIQPGGVCANCQQVQAVVNPMEKESLANEHSDPDWKEKGTDCVQAHPNHHLCPRNAASKQPGWVMGVEGSLSNWSYGLQLEPETQSGASYKTSQVYMEVETRYTCPPSYYEPGMFKRDDSITELCVLNLTYVPFPPLLLLRQMVSHCMSQCQGRISMSIFLRVKKHIFMLRIAMQMGQCV